MFTLGFILLAIEGAAIAKAAAGFGAAIAALAAAMGIGKIGSSAMESIARQPEAAGDIRSNMIVAAALIEGVAFFAIVVCFLILFV
ncbi:MAG TPA: ATP synthase F0 subunit C [Bacteroidales bacterium]|nr:ATP synthase F0 subunit C [Bacteroidales bacterium]